MKKSTWIKILVCTLLLVPAVYISVQLFAIMNRPYHTQTAISYKMADTITVNGIYAAQQVQLTYDGGVLSCLAADGERVSAGANVAAVFNNNEAAQSYDYARQLQIQLDYLKRAQDASAAATDIQLLAKQINTTLTEVAALIDTGNLTSVTEYKLQLQYYYNKLQLGTSQSIDLSAVLAAVDAAYQSAGANGTPAGYVTASERGYFVSAANGAAQQYTAEELDAMTPQQLQQAAAQETTANVSGTAGYIITDNTWRYYITVPLKQADKFSTAAGVYLSFTQADAQAIPVTVQDITLDEENDVAKIVLVSDYFNNNVIGQNTRQATVYFGTAGGLYYEGLRVDKAALRIVDGVYGVYIKYGNVAYFRPITILFENDDYLLVASGSEDTTSKLKRFDEVIVFGKDLYDEKIL